MSVTRYAGSLIPPETFARGGLWPAEKQADTTPALHKRVVEEAEPQAPSALHPRVDAPAKRRRARSAPTTTKRPTKARAKAAKPPAELVDAFDAVTDAMADSIRAGMEPRIRAAARQAAARVVVDIFGGSDR